MNVTTAQKISKTTVRIVPGYEAFASIDFGDIDESKVSVYMDTPEDMESLAKKLEAGAKTLRAMRSET